MPNIALVDDDRKHSDIRLDRPRGRGLPRADLYRRGRWRSTVSRPIRPDLAIFDIKMPRMDGMELLRRLRQKSDVPVIFLTSKDEEIDELFGLKMGADDYIRKPFSQRLLVERVKAIPPPCQSQGSGGAERVRGQNPRAWPAQDGTPSATPAPGRTTRSRSRSPNS